MTIASNSIGKVRRKKMTFFEHIFDPWHLTKNKAVTKYDKIILPNL